MMLSISQKQLGDLWHLFLLHYYYLEGNLFTHIYFIYIYLHKLNNHSHYCLDNPAAVQEQIEEAYKINAAEYNLLYSSYSLPNIILVLVGGFFIDKVGMRIGITIFNTLLCVGQAMFAISAIPHNENYWLAISARFVFG